MNDFPYVCTITFWILKQKNEDHPANDHFPR